MKAQSKAGTLHSLMPDEVSFPLLPPLGAVIIMIPPPLSISVQVAVEDESLTSFPRAPSFIPCGIRYSFTLLM